MSSNSEMGSMSELSSSPNGEDARIVAEEDEGVEVIYIQIMP